jgi:hypothetical protein
VKLKQLAAIASIGLLVSCSSDKSGGPTGLAGQLSFTYSGGVSGTFNVTGEMPTSTAAQETQSWAAGEVITTGGAANTGTFVVGATPRVAGSTHDVVVVQANRTNAGTAIIDENTCTTAATCSEVLFLVGSANGTSTAFQQICVLTTGSIVITEITTTRIRGTFSGAGDCSTSTGTVTAFTVTNGTFDVAIVPGVS